MPSNISRTKSAFKIKFGFNETNKNFFLKVEDPTLNYEGLLLLGNLLVVE